MEAGKNGASVNLHEKRLKLSKAALINGWDQKSSSVIGANISSHPNFCASVLPVKSRHS